MQFRCTGFAPNGTTLASGGADTRIYLWDTGTVVASKPLAGAIDLDAAWEGLADPSGKVSLEAEYRLLASPKISVPFLKERLLSNGGPSETDLRTWVANLDSDDFEVREAAYAALAKVGPVAESALRTARTRPISLEMRRRIDGLLAKLEPRGITLAERRLMRAVEVLEQIGTADARTILQELATGAPAALLSREARAALGRLKE